MSEINSLKELNKRKCLEHKDIVKFTINEEKTIEYSVGPLYLSDSRKIYPINNDKIFRILDIDKDKIAEKAYGYNPVNVGKNTRYPNNYWPEVDNDYSALTRLVREVYLIIEEREPKYTKYNKFEIMDI